MKKFSFILLSIFLSTVICGADQGGFGGNLSKIYNQLGLKQNISYTAEMISEGGMTGKDKRFTFQMYYKDGNIRTEGEQAGMKFMMIMKADGTIYSYNDAMKKWVMTSMNTVMDKNSRMPEYVKIGEENVDGKNCIRFEAVDPETKLKNIVWVNDGIIFKNMSIIPNGAEQVVYYRNVVKKDLDDALFMPPQGEDVQDMSEMIKALMAGANKGSADIS